MLVDTNLGFKFTHGSLFVQAIWLTFIIVFYRFSYNHSLAVFKSCDILNFFFWKPCMIKFNWSVDFMFQHLAFSRSWNEEEDKEVDRCWTVGVSDLISVVSQYEREREGNQKSAREHQADRPRGWATVSPCPHHCFLLHVAFPVWSGCWALVQWHCCLLYPAVHTSHSWRVLLDTSLCAREMNPPDVTKGRFQDAW